MAQVDTYLKRQASDPSIGYLDDFYELYSFVSNIDLRRLFACYKCLILRLFGSFRFLCRGLVMRRL